jgi:hypothetical protein
MDQALTTTTDTAVAIPAQALDLFNLAAFKDAYHIAGILAKSQLIPKAFQGNVTDCIIAMEMAQRIGAGVFAVMQSLYIVHGKPGWSATFIIGALNACGRFAPLRFDITEPAESAVNGKKIMDRVCTAWTIEKGTGERLEGPPVSIEMAHREGWFDKSGSKWQTMPELMLRYRAATFFGRLYAPDILMGMRTAEELVDHPSDVAEVSGKSVGSDLNARFGGKETIDAETGEIVAPPESNPTQPRNVELKEQPQQTPPPPEDPGPQEEPQVQATDEPEKQPDSSEIPPKVRAFMKEINAATVGGSVAVDTWIMKHHNRAANALGGPESPLYKQVMEYADQTYKGMLEAEADQKKGLGA